MHIDNKIVPFSNLEIPDWYEPALDLNLNTDIYIPILSNSKSHKRFTYGFSAKVLETLLPGLEGLILNDGRMQLVFGQVLNEEEYKSVQEGLKEKENGLEFICMELLDKLIEESKIKKSQDFHLRLMSLLIGSGRLEIKFAFKLVDSLRPYQHSKISIFEGSNGEEIAWSGSNNLSNNASEEHLEDFSIYQTFKPEGGSKVHIPRIKEMFERTWNNDYPGWGVCSVSSKFYGTWRKAFPQTSKKEIKEAIEAIRKEIRNRDEHQPHKPFPLRAHQKDAIEAWWESQQRGILDHATGSGKTYTAIRAIQALRLTTKQLAVVIGVPFKPLADQWADQLNDHFHHVMKDKFIFNGVIGCYSGEGNWQQKIIKESNNFNESFLENRGHLAVYLVVNKSLASDEFQKFFMDKNRIDPKRTLFIGDECHNYTSKIYRDSLNPEVAFRLGLSATAFNDEKHKTKEERSVAEYFGEICHRYSLKDGIRDGHLSNYYYHPIVCTLEDEEFHEWKEYLNNYKKTGDEKNKTAEKIEKIIDGSKDKYSQFLQLIKDIPKKDTIVFAGQGKVDDHRAIDYVSSEMDISGWAHTRITADENKKERKSAIYGFQRGDIDTICAIRVLDEGIDIPSIKTAIILASSDKRRQFIQRRGRVLRKDDEKEYADIYDFIVLPPAKFNDAGRELINREMARVKEMGLDALNSKEVKMFMNNYKGLYDTF